MAATPDDAYEPFRDCSGWFSQSVSEDTVKLWREYGGDYSDCGSADYLFGVDLNDEDIDQVYYNSFGITVFRSDWILEVVKSGKEIEDVPISPFLLLPQYTDTKSADTKSVDTKPPKMLTPHALYKKKSAITNNEAPTTTMTERPHATGIRLRHYRDIIGSNTIRFLDLRDAKQIIIKKKKDNN